MSINSHIQIPAGILKYFSDSSKRVYYLNLETGTIGMAGAKKLGAEYGYYSDEHEMFLNKEIEQPLTSLASKIRHAFTEDTTSFSLSIEEERTLKKYIAASVARSGLAYDTMQKNLGIYSRLLLSSQQKHDFISRFGATTNNPLYQTIEDYYLVVLINKTDRNWVVPRNCFYTVSSLEHECIVAPISPQCALCLFPPERIKTHHESYLHRLGVVDSPSVVADMNVRALLYEYIFNRKFVASATKIELEKLKDHLNRSRLDLEKYHKETRDTK